MGLVSPANTRASCAVQMALQPGMGVLRLAESLGCSNLPKGQEVEMCPDYTSELYPVLVETEARKNGVGEEAERVWWARMLGAKGEEERMM